MFGQLRPEFLCLQRENENSIVWKDKVRILMFGQIRPEFQYLKG